MIAGRNAKCGMAITATLGLSAMAAFAETKSALQEITDTADRICGIVATSGSSQSVKATGEIKAELNGLVKKFANVGGSLAGGIDSATYDGLVQTALPKALEDLRSCKLSVFLVLQKKLLPETAPPDAVSSPVVQPASKAAGDATTRGDEGKVFLLREPMPLRRRPGSYDDNPVAQLAAGDEVTVLRDDRSDGWKYVRDDQTHKEGFLPASAMSSR